MIKLPEVSVTQLVLTDDVVIDNSTKGNYWQLRDALHHPAPWYSGGNQPWSLTIPKGTVFNVGPYRASNSDYGSYMHLSIVQCPGELKFLPKRRGGTGRRVHITVRLSELKTWPVEEYNS